MEFKNGGSSSQRRPAVEEGAPLARQGSVYSLTFDEFQSAAGPCCPQKYRLSWEFPGCR